MKKEEQQRARTHCTTMADQHTKLSIISNVSSFTDNIEVSNTNSDGLMDTDDSKLDYEYEVSNWYSLY
jgi:hypothetical protein